jgi:hypothetical protein
MGIGLSGGDIAQEKSWRSECSFVDEETEGESGLCFGYNRGASKHVLKRRMDKARTDQSLKTLVKFIFDNLSKK